jgi:hypothetical protein
MENPNANNYDDAINTIRAQMQQSIEESTGKQMRSGVLQTIGTTLGIASGANGFVRKDQTGHIQGIDPVGAAGMAITLTIALTAQNLQRQATALMQGMGLKHAELGKLMGDRNVQNTGDNFKDALAQNNAALAREIASAMRETLMPEGTTPTTIRNKPVERDDLTPP